MYDYANMPPNMMAGANVPPNVPPTMVAGAMDEPMPYYGAPSYGYVHAAPAHKNSFVLIVVLFILLIIVGSSFPKC